MVKAAKMLIPLFLFLLSGISNAQDVLVLKSGRELKVIITEETSALIKYREFENTSGPLFSIDRTKVESVRYGKKPKVKEPEVQTAKNDIISDQASGDQTLSVKKRYVYQGGVILSSRKVKTIMEDNQPAVDLFTKGRKQCTASNACAYGVIFTCMGANLITNKMEHDRAMKILVPALAISGGFIISGIVLASSGKKNIRRSVEMYNSVMSKPVSYELDFSISAQGVGVALRF